MVSKAKLFLQEIKKTDILIHYANSRAKNFIYKVFLFDELQALYNNLVAKTGVGKPFEVPDIDFFGEDDDDRHRSEKVRAEKDKEKSKLLMLNDFREH